MQVLYFLFKKKIFEIINHIKWQVHNINEELNINKLAVPENSDNLSVEEEKDEYDDKRPMIEKEEKNDNSLMATFIGKWKWKRDNLIIEVFQEETWATGDLGISRRLRTRLLCENRKIHG